MTKWGMPGVYTYAFMDGWSPGYLGSVAYNHNGMMRMYETQSGAMTRPHAAAAAAARRRGHRRRRRPVRTPPRAARRGAAARREAPRRRGGRGGRGGGASGGGGRAPASRRAARRGQSGPRRPRRRRRGTQRGFPVVPTGRGGGQQREWYRGIPIPPNARRRTSRAATTRTTWRPASSRRCSSRRCSRTSSSRTSTSRRRTRSRTGRTKAPYGYVIPVQRDMTRVGDAREHPARPGHRSRPGDAEIKIGDGTFPAGSYVIKRNQPYGRLAKNLLEKQDYPGSRLTTYDDSGWSMGWPCNVDVKEIKDKAILDAPVTPVDDGGARRARSPAAARPASPSRTFGSNNMIAFRYRLKDVPMKIAEKRFTADGVDFPAGLVRRSARRRICRRRARRSRRSG